MQLLLPHVSTRNICHQGEWGTKAKCGLSPSGPTCTLDGDCSWASSLLKALFQVEPSYARIGKELPDENTALNSFMEDLANPDGQTKTGTSKLKTVNGPAERIIAIGDVHGDIEAMRTALRNACIIDKEDRWIGGRSVLVQVGDQLDRGQDERAIYKLLFKLQDKAPKAGGAVHILLGNHELMNARLDFRYVTRGGFEDFIPASQMKEAGSGKIDDDDHLSVTKQRKWRPRIAVDDLKMIRALPAAMQARARSIVAGGPLATELGRRAKIAVLVGDTVFIHAGLSPRHLVFGGRDQGNGVDMLDEINDDTSKFLQGQAPYPPILHGQSSPVWMRDYSRPGVRQGSPECKMLAETLRMIGAKRMVVGHTPQAEGINAACGGKVWRVDTGMSKAYGGVPEALEISRRGHIRIHTQNGMVHGSARSK